MANDDGRARRSEDTQDDTRLENEGRTSRRRAEERSESGDASGAGGALYGGQEYGATYEQGEAGWRTQSFGDARNEGEPQEHDWRDRKYSGAGTESWGTTQDPWTSAEAALDAARGEDDADHQENLSGDVKPTQG